MRGVWLRIAPLAIAGSALLSGCLPDRPDPSRLPLIDQFDSAVRDKDLGKAERVSGQILAKPMVRLETFYHIHDAYARADMPEAAIQIMRRVLKERPELGELDRANLWRSIGSDLFAMGEIEDATKAYERAMELDKNNPLILSDYAYFLAETGGDLEKARACARQALLTDPKEPAYLDTLGWVAFKDGQKSLALDYFIQALTIDANNPELRLHAAQAYEAVGRKSQAVEFYSTCVDSGQMYRKVSETAIARLKVLDLAVYAKATTVKKSRVAED